MRVFPALLISISPYVDALGEECALVEWPSYYINLSNSQRAEQRPSTFFPRFTILRHCGFQENKQEPRSRRNFSHFSCSETEQRTVPILLALWVLYRCNIKLTVRILKGSPEDKTRPSSAASIAPLPSMSPISKALIISGSVPVGNGALGFALKLCPYAEL